MPWQQLVNGLNLAEGPCDDGKGGLYFSDMPNGGVFHLAPDGSVTSVLMGRPHVGGIVPHTDGGIVVSGPTLLHVNGDSQRVLMDAADSCAWSINDIATDHEGRLYAGTLGASPANGPPEKLGSLWQVDSDGTVRHCYDDVEVTNGLAVSPDGTVLYHADTYRGIIWASDIGSHGPVSRRRAFFDPGDGTNADGIALDAEGYLWVATLGSYVLRIDPSGAVVDRLDTPFSFVATLAFVGDDLDRMVVCTGKQDGVPRSGGIWMIEAPVAGLRVVPAAA